MNSKHIVQIDDFAKLEFKVGTVISAEEIEGSDRLLKLQVDFGSKAVIPSEERVEESLNQDLSTTVEMTEGHDEQPNEIRQILSGIKQWYKPEDLVGKQFVFITNLAPRKMMGLESQGMIMAAEGEEKPIPLTVSEKVPNGAKIR